jgi:hypothetical protein
VKSVMTLLNLTDDSEEICLFICGICQKSVASLRRHIVKHHQLSLKAYRVTNLDVYERKTYHR